MTCPSIDAVDWAWTEPLKQRRANNSKYLVGFSLCERKAQKCRAREGTGWRSGDAISCLMPLYQNLSGKSRSIRKSVIENVHNLGSVNFLLGDNYLGRSLAPVPPLTKGFGSTAPLSSPARQLSLKLDSRFTIAAGVNTVPSRKHPSISERQHQSGFP